MCVFKHTLFNPFSKLRENNYNNKILKLKTQWIYRDYGLFVLIYPYHFQIQKFS